MFCCMLLYVHSSFAIILMGKRELVAMENTLVKAAFLNDQNTLEISPSHF